MNSILTDYRGYYMRRQDDGWIVYRVLLDDDDSIILLKVNEGPLTTSRESRRFIDTQISRRRIDDLVEARA